MAQPGSQGLVRLRRHNTGTPWGFRMNGGREYGHALYVQQVSPNALAYKAGLRPGDAILQIGSVLTQRMSHQEAKMEIIRAGNEVDFYVVRGAVDVKQQGADTPDSGQPQRAVVEERSQFRPEPAPSEPQSQSRSFRLLQMSLTTAEPQGKA